MKSILRSSLAAAAVLALTAAAPPSEPIERQLRAWIAGATGLPLADFALNVAPEGDHYRLSAKLPGVEGAAGPAVLTATLRPLDGGRWEVSDLALPSPARFPLRVPDPDSPGQTLPARARLAIGGQDGRLVIDPALASASTFALRLDGMTLNVEGGGQRQHQAIAHYETTGTLTPAPGGRLDLAQEGVAEGWRAEAATPGGQPFAMAATRLRLKGGLGGLNPERLAPTIAALAAFSATPQEDAQALRAALHALAEALRDSLRSGTVEETLEGLRLTIGGVEGGVASLRFGLQGEAPEGKLAGAILIEAKGFDIPSLPPAFAAWMPQTIALRPALSGAAAEKLSRLALAATAPQADEAATEAALADLLRDGVTVAIDPLVVELPMARLDATGDALVRGPDSYEAKAKVTLAGYDRLLAAARQDPTLGEAVPYLELARRLARPEGDKLVWLVAAGPGGATVNGVDVAQLAAAAQAPAPPPRPAARPRQ